MKKLRVKEGRNKDDVIMVSASDYESLIGSGVYEPADACEEEKVMKSVYGKKESPYKRSETGAKVTGPRQRVVLGLLPEEGEEVSVGDAQNKEEGSQNEEGWSF